MFPSREDARQQITRGICEIFDIESVHGESGGEIPPSLPRKKLRRSACSLERNDSTNEVPKPTNKALSLAPEAFKAIPKVPETEEKCKTRKKSRPRRRAPVKELTLEENRLRPIEDETNDRESTVSIQHHYIRCQRSAKPSNICSIGHSHGVVISFVINPIGSLPSLIFY